MRQRPTTGRSAFSAHRLRLPTILLGNHILVKFNFVIITAEKGAEGLAPWRCGSVGNQEVRGNRSIVSFSRRATIPCALWKRAKRREKDHTIPIFPPSFSPTPAELCRERSIKDDE